jgi:ABC-type histidine transport system ATPase subunit
LAEPWRQVGHCDSTTGGMVRLLDLEMTLMGNSRVRAVWQIIRDLVAGGVTIFLTTQYLDEADQPANRIAVLDNGRLVAEGTPHELAHVPPRLPMARYTPCGAISRCGALARC